MYFVFSLLRDIFAAASHNNFRQFSFFFSYFRRKTLQLQRESSRANHQVKPRSSNTASYFNFESPNMAAAAAAGELSSLSSEATRSPTSAKSRMDVQMEAEAVHYQRPQYRSMNGNNSTVGAILRNPSGSRERHGTILSLIHI